MLGGVWGHIAQLMHDYVSCLGFYSWAFMSIVVGDPLCEIIVARIVDWKINSPGSL